MQLLHACAEPMQLLQVESGVGDFKRSSKFLQQPIFNLYQVSHYAFAPACSISLPAGKVPSRAFQWSRCGTSLLCKSMQPALCSCVLKA